MPTAWQNKSLYDRIHDRYTELDNDYAKINHIRDIITTFFRSDEIVRVDDKGNLVGECIYNGSPSWYSRVMSTGFQGSLVSKNIAWIRYQMGQYELKGIDELDLWLQEVHAMSGSLSVNRVCAVTLLRPHHHTPGSGTHPQLLWNPCQHDSTVQNMRP